MAISRLLVLCLSLLALAALAACSASGMFDGAATIQVRLTDAPSDVIAAAEVSISSVRLLPGGEDGTFIELLAPEEVPATFDLLDLRNGVEALLAQKPVPEGTYQQLRLVVDGATVTLADGYAFQDGTTTRDLPVPSGSQSGIKVHLAEPLAADPGFVTVVVVDFDVNESFVMQGPPDATDDIHGFLFTPSLVEKRRASEDL